MKIKEKENLIKQIDMDKKLVIKQATSNSDKIAQDAKSIFITIQRRKLKMAEELTIKEYVAGLVEKARAAQKIAENFTQEDVDLITAAVTYALTKPENIKEFAEKLVEESGMGIPADKEGKIIGKVWGSYLQMKDKKT